LFPDNDSWCNCNNMQELKSFCSPDLEFFNRVISQENSLRLLSHPCISPSSRNHDGPQGTGCKLETIYPEAAFIVAGDFNKENLRKRLPKYYQYINCNTRTGKTLDHCYFNFHDAYKALPRPPFGKSDHDSV
jgi:hypothetical protein